MTSCDNFFLVLSFASEVFSHVTSNRMMKPETFVEYITINMF